MRSNGDMVLNAIFLFLSLKTTQKLILPTSSLEHTLDRIEYLIPVRRTYGGDYVVYSLNTRLQKHDFYANARVVPYTVYIRMST
jgi:hypothetical protein